MPRRVLGPEFRFQYAAILSSQLHHIGTEPCSPEGRRLSPERVEDHDRAVTIAHHGARQRQRLRPLAPARSLFAHGILDRKLRAMRIGNLRSQARVALVKQLSMNLEQETGGKTEAGTCQLESSKTYGEGNGGCGMCDPMT